MWPHTEIVNRFSVTFVRIGTIQRAIAQRNGLRGGQRRQPVHFVAGQALSVAEFVIFASPDHVFHRDFAVKEVACKVYAGDFGSAVCKAVMYGALPAAAGAGAALALQ